MRPFVRRMDSKEAGDALDHDAAHLCDGEADESDAACRRVVADVQTKSAGADPFGTGAGFARSAAAETEPSPTLFTLYSICTKLSLRCQ